MLRDFVLICIIVAACSTGCLESQSTDRSRDARGGGTAAEVIERLKSENLPAVESIEVWPNGYGGGIVLTT
ncbi:MAG: hypothetical protein ACYSR6_02505, partial [Planctomycetota bacterium]